MQTKAWLELEDEYFFLLKNMLISLSAFVSFLRSVFFIRSFPFRETSVFVAILMYLKKFSTKCCSMGQIINGGAQESQMCQNLVEVYYFFMSFCVFFHEFLCGLGLCDSSCSHLGPLNIDRDFSCCERPQGLWW